MTLPLELGGIGDQFVRRALENIAQHIPIQTPDFGKIPKARVFNSAAFGTTTGAGAVVTFDSERYDNDAIHSVAANTSRLTVVTPGNYFIFGSVVWAGAAGAGLREVGIRLNGATLLATQDDFPGAAAESQSVSTAYQLAVGDFVELFVIQTSGGNLNVNATGNTSPEFGMTWLGP